MKKLTVEFENCYGINSLNHVFDFDKHNTIVLYAPNGMMKTSFSKTLLNISKGEKPEEIIFGYTSVPKILADNLELLKENIFVIESMNERFNSEQISTLLVDNDARIKYEEITKELLSSQSKFINKLNKMSGIVKTNNKIEQTIQSDFD
ncbi:MAG: hypothetical protein RQ763_11580, partial [Sulfurimonas sp.]|nr:hypothetical protein [Sulfurimonas sp.]